MTKRKSPLSRAAALAHFWCVHLRTAQRWIAEPGRPASPPTPPALALEFDTTAAAAPASAIAAMVTWVRSLPSGSQAKLTADFRARIDSFRVALERGTLADSAPATPNRGGSAAAIPPGSSAPPPPGSDPTEDPDYSAFLRDRAAARAAGPLDTNTTLASLKLRFEYADYKVGLAQKRGDHAACREWTDTAARLAGVIHDEELRAQRLGREIGDNLPRPEVERLIAALVYWHMRAADDLLATVSPRLAAASGTLFTEEVRALLEPYVLAARVLEPLRRATQVRAAHTLPEWVLQAFRAALAAHLEPLPEPLATTGPTPPGPSPVAPPSAPQPQPPAAASAAAL